MVKVGDKSNYIKNSSQHGDLGLAFLQ